MFDRFEDENMVLKSKPSKEGMSYIDRVLEIDRNHVDAINHKGDQLIRLNKHEAASLFIERALELDPNHIDALFNKATLLANKDNWYEAMTLFDKILTDRPNHLVAQKNLVFAQSYLGNEPLDGYMEAIVHDSKGDLVMHLKIPKLRVLSHDIGRNFVDQWPVKEIVTRNGEDYEVLQYELNKDVYYASIYGGAAHYGIQHEVQKKVWKVYANYWQYLVQKGDSVRLVYTVFRPVA